MSSSDSSDGVATPSPASPSVAVQELLDSIPKSDDIGPGVSEKTDTAHPVLVRVDDVGSLTPPEKEQVPHQVDEGANDRNTASKVDNGSHLPGSPNDAKPTPPVTSSSQEATVPPAGTTLEQEATPLPSAPKSPVVSAADPSGTFEGDIAGLFSNDEDGAATSGSNGGTETNVNTETNEDEGKVAEEDAGSKEEAGSESEDRRDTNSDDSDDSEDSDEDDGPHIHDPFDRDAALESFDSNRTFFDSVSIPGDTTAKKLWEEMKKHGEESEALDRLMDLVGLDNVKMQFLKIKATIDEARRRKGWLRYRDLNMAFVGNAGTGKTTVARLYMDLLDELKIWPDPQDRKEYMGYSLQTWNNVKDFYEDSDWRYYPQGAVFIDEFDRCDSEIHGYLANVLSGLPEKRVIVLTGSVLGVSKVLGFRPQSRWECWRRVQLPDFTDEQLKVMLLRFIDRNNLLVDGGAESPYPLMLAKRVGRGRGTDGFGNAHDIALAFEQMLERQAHRLKQAELERLAAEDNSKTETTESGEKTGEDDSAQVEHRNSGENLPETDPKQIQPTDPNKAPSETESKLVESVHSTELSPQDESKPEQLADPAKDSTEAESKPAQPIDTEKARPKDDSEPGQPAATTTVDATREESKPVPSTDSAGSPSETEPKQAQPTDPEEENAPEEEKEEEVYKPVLIMSDFMGPEPAELWEESAAWKELNQMAGLEDVKKAVRSLMRRSKTNYHRELRGKEPLQMSLNRLFLGPPGTGKTTVAKLYGQILGELGLVSSKDVVFTTPSDFIGPYTGQTETRTASIVDSAAGKVLIIDDAHTFFTRDETSFLGDDLDSFRRACIDTLVSRIHNKPGEDRCVILIGYADKMEDMFQKCNPGLKRRFPLEEAFRFDDYDDGQLNEILKIKMEKEEIKASQEALKVAAEVLRRARDRPNFGNGGDVDNLLNQAKTRFRERKVVEKEKEASKLESERSLGARADDNGDVLNQKETTDEPGGDDLEDLSDDEDPDRVAIDLEPQDFDPEWDRGTNPESGNKASSLFDGLLGFDDIRKQFEGYQLMAANMRRRGKDPRESIPFTYVFKGPPGTGKTHTARIMGKMFYRMGFLSTDEVVECSASHMIGQYMGQTAPKVISLLDSALGKVLFIDEAYRLTSTGGRGYESEAIGELVDSMTKPRYLRKMIIILAGYNKDMNLLLKSNAGLRGRFPTEIRFKPMDEELSRAHLIKLLAKQDIEIYDAVKASSDDHETVLRLFHKLGMTEGWSNGRDILSLANVITAEVYRSMPLVEDGEGVTGGNKEEDEEKLHISTKRLIKFLRDMFRERIKAGSSGDGGNSGDKSFGGAA